MNSGRLYIDSIEANSIWNVYAAEQGWNDLLSFPPMKEPEVNDWYEEEGEETDLSAPVLASRNVQLTFNFCGWNTPIFFRQFIKSMKTFGSHEFDIRSLGVRRRIRYVSCGSVTCEGDLITARMTFAEDNPTITTDTSYPRGNAPDTGYSLDGVPFYRYGITVLKGALGSILATGQAKKCLSRDISTRPGLIYDTLKPEQLGGWDVNIPMLTRANSLAELWKLRDQFLRDLMKPGERKLTCKKMNVTLPCRYKSCRVTAFWPDKRPWLQSTLTLRMIGAYPTDYY